MSLNPKNREEVLDEIAVIENFISKFRDDGKPCGELKVLLQELIEKLEEFKGE